MATGLDYFETRWKPKSWNARYRFIFIRKQVRCQHKLPIQLDLFQPTEYGYEFKVIVTNKRMTPRKVVAFHEGRGSQEGIFAELKTHCQMDYIPVKTRVGNQLYMFAGIVAHNLTRELQIQLDPRAVAPPQSAPRCGASERLEPFAVPSSNAPAHDSPSREADPLHEHQRKTRKRTPAGSRNTERRR